jgi:hypothetical protein
LLLCKVFNLFEADAATDDFDAAVGVSGNGACPVDGPSTGSTPTRRDN